MANNGDFSLLSLWVLHSFFENVFQSQPFVYLHSGQMIFFERVFIVKGRYVLSDIKCFYWPCKLLNFMNIVYP